MAYPDEAKIRKTMRAVLLTLSTLPAYRAWENRTGKPTVDQPKVSDQLTPVDESQRASGLYEYNGMYIVEISVPTGRGTELLDSLLFDVVNLFPSNRGIQGDLMNIQVDRAFRTSRLKDPTGKFYTAQVRVLFRTYTPTT